MAQLWEKGDAVHLVYAYFWYSLATIHGCAKAAEDRDRVGKFLSIATRNDGDGWVQRWKPTLAPAPPAHFYGDKTADIFDWLQSWYAFHANDDDWREEYGLNIGTLANPGWSVKIDLGETSLEIKPFKEINEDHGNNDWMACQVKDRKFEAMGDTSKLRMMLEVFRTWASEPFREENSERLDAVKALVELSDDLDVLSERLKKYRWDFDGAALILSQTHVSNVLKRYLMDEIDAHSVEKWADLIECRDDIDCKTDEVLQVIHDLANPSLCQPLDKNWAQELTQTVLSAPKKK